MKYGICLFVVLIFSACKLTKTTSSNTNIEPTGPSSDEDILQFDCYYSADTLDNLIAYFPEEKMFYLNNEQAKKEDICEVIKNSIKLRACWEI